MFHLSKRTQRTKISDAYSSYTNIKYGVLQVSLLGPLFVNIEVCELFLCDYKCEKATYEDDNTPYTSYISLKLVSEKLLSSKYDLIRWFKENLM